MSRGKPQLPLRSKSHSERDLMGPVEPKSSEMSDTATAEIIEFDTRGDLVINIGQPGHASFRSFRVCSRTLARISPVFDRMLYGSFAESKPPGAEDWVVNLPDDKPGALGLLLRIAHGEFALVPRELSANSFYDLTVAAHYWDATKILVPWAEHWISSVVGLMGHVHNRMLKLLWIAWEFGRRDLFETTARRLVMEAPGTAFKPGSPLEELQMPPDIIGKRPGASVVEGLYMLTGD